MKLRIAITLALAGAAIAHLMGCSSSSSNPSPPTPAPIAHMYVSLFAVAGGVQIYNLPITSASVPTGTISGLNDPGELFVERSSGRLFVPIEGSTSTVNVYNAPITGASTPAFALTTTNTNVESVTEDTSGNVYVGVDPNGTCCIEVFNHPVNAAASSSFVINSNGVSPNGLGAPYGMGFDSSGNLYVSSTSSVIKLAPPFSSASVPVANVPPNVDNYGLVVDAANNIYVANSTINGTIDVFTQPFTSASVRSYGILVSGVPVYGMALDGSGNLWFVDESATIWKIAAPITSSSTPVSVLTGVTNAYGIAFGP
jgi:hypothetical protein